MEDIINRRTCYHCKGQKYIRGRICPVCYGRGWIIPIVQKPDETAAVEKRGPARKEPAELKKEPEAAGKIQKEIKKKPAKRATGKTSPRPEDYEPKSAGSKKTTKKKPVKKAASATSTRKTTAKEKSAKTKKTPSKR